MPSDACSLSSLLEEEWFLLMVFEHLVEHGLRDCRLVCRRWYEVCQLFPVELYQVDGKRLREIISVFPKATSIAMVNREKEIPEVEFFHCLTQLPTLRLLRLRQKTLSHTLPGQLYFQSIPQLTELALKLNGSAGTAGMLASIDHLTGLTKLKLTSGSLYLEPCTFRSLKRIRELKTDFDFFADGHGTCFFPALTNLTRLDLMSERKENLRQPNRVIYTQGISLFASSLRYLSLLVYSRQRTVNFAPLTSLTALETLEVERKAITQEGFRETFQEMRCIRTLRTDFSGYLDENARESIAALPGLKTLDCRAHFMHNDDEDSIPLARRISQLTDLIINVNGKLVADLGCLTRLVVLKLRVFCDVDCILDCALACMPGLQGLGVKFAGNYSENEANRVWKNLSLSSSALSKMKKLQVVFLDRVDVDELFFQQLASKPKLKGLGFCPSKNKTYSQSFLSQINTLKSIQLLMLRVADHCNVSKLLSPQCLPRIKELTLKDAAVGQVEALRRRFSSLGQVLINHDESPWCSRLNI